MEFLNGKWIWKISNSGDFFFSPTCKAINCRFPRSLVADRILDPHIPINLSINMWKILNKPLPLDDNIQTVGIWLASRCHTCLKNSRSGTHLFLQCTKVRMVWEFYSNLMGINFDMNHDDAKIQHHEIRDDELK